MSEKLPSLENHFTFLFVAAGVSFYGINGIDYASKQLET